MPKKAKKQKSKKAKKQKKVKKIRHEIELIIGKKIDFIQLKRYKENGKKEWEKKIGVPYWLINSKGVIENKNYIFTEQTDEVDFSLYLSLEQVLITKE